MNIFLALVLLFLVANFHWQLLKARVTDPYPITISTQRGPHDKAVIFSETTTLPKALKNGHFTEIPGNHVRSELINRSPTSCFNSQKFQTAKGNNLWYCFDNDSCFESKNDCDIGFDEVTNDEVKFNFRCIPKSNLPIYSDGFGYLSVADCPEGFDSTNMPEICQEKEDGNLRCPFLNKTVSQLCKESSTLEESGPFVIHNNSLVFKNKFCAFCNGIYDFEYFNVFYLLTNSIYKTISELDKAAVHQALVPFRREMIPPINSKITSCKYNMKSSNILNDCQRFTDPIVIHDGYFDANSTCRENFDIRYRDYFSDEKDWVFNGIERGNQLMSVFFKFNAVDNAEDQSYCQVWNEEMRKTGQCQDFDLYQNADKLLMLYMHANANLTNDEFWKVGMVLSYIYEINNLVTVKMMQTLYFEDENRVAQVKFVVRFLKTAFKHEIDNFFDDIVTRKITFYLNRKSAKGFIRIELIHGSFLNHSNVILYRTSVLSSERYIHVDLNRFTFDKECANFSILGKISPYSKLVVQKVLCLEKIQKSDTLFTIGNVVTYTCFGISIISLLFLILIQRILGLVTNIPSSNTENIAISLLMSNSLFVFGARADVNKIVCYYIGASLHYLWLSVFSFMSIGVVSLGCTLTKLRSRIVVKSDTKKKQRILLTLLGLVTPLPIVGTAMLIDMFGPVSWSAGYDSVPCFPKRYPANLAFFTGPIVSIICFNLCYLIYTICKVCGVRIGVSNVRKLNPYTEAKIYLRISASSGVLWFIGILDAIFDEEWLSFAFTVVCGLQGFFIALSNFTSNRFRNQKEETSSGSL